MWNEPSPRSLHSRLCSDHRKIDAILRRFESRVLEGNLRGSRGELAELREVLTEHLQFEEEYVFPLCEGDADTGRPGPIAILRIEHAHIRRLLEEIHHLCGSEHPDRRRFTALRRTLVDLLQVHLATEDRILYPMAERIERIRRRMLETLATPCP